MTPRSAMRGRPNTNGQNMQNVILFLMQLVWALLFAVVSCLLLILLVPIVLGRLCKQVSLGLLFLLLTTYSWSDGITNTGSRSNYLKRSGWR